jgi:hypothetical protein
MVEPLAEAKIPEDTRWMPRFWIARGVVLSDRRASSTPVALAMGFAVVFALWLLWGYQLGRSLKNIEQSCSRSGKQPRC